MELNEKIKNIKEKIESAVKDIKSSKKLQEIKMKFLGKSGEISELLKNMRDVPPEQRPSFGKLLNTLRQETEEKFDALEGSIKKIELKKRYSDEKIDVTIPGKVSQDGAFHPNTLIRNELVSIFAGMGFEIFEGPEIENDYYNFTALNTPKDHPARDMQDTFYLSNDLLLRTQTSAGQIRVMENKKPPIKILCPGKVYRSDDDATHSPMFSQMEGLVVDKGITLCDLK
ncbi:MAG: phenylalanine--tRNA ligase subunit alpha, partial [Clostridia bacterium]|nr:phenylalanine--tRNA ligase subunit alpha [Clostridia bacterium]